MYWQNPLLVREVKTQLKNAMMSAGVTAASGVVDALIGTLVGSILSKTNNRDYINFVGEIAGRSLTPTQRKVMSRAYVASREDSHIDKEGKDMNKTIFQLAYRQVKVHKSQYFSALIRRKGRSSHLNNSF